MVPEVIRKGQHSPKTDVFGLGAILFFMVTAREPYEYKLGKLSQKHCLNAECNLLQHTTNSCCAMLSHVQVCLPHRQKCYCTAWRTCPVMSILNTCLLQGDTFGSLAQHSEAAMHVHRRVLRIVSSCTDASRLWPLPASTHFCSTVTDNAGARGLPTSETAWCRVTGDLL